MRYPLHAQLQVQACIWSLFVYLAVVPAAVSGEVVHTVAPAPEATAAETTDSAASSAAAPSTSQEPEKLTTVKFGDGDLDSKNKGYGYAGDGLGIMKDPDGTISIRVTEHEVAGDKGGTFRDLVTNQKGEIGYRKDGAFQTIKDQKVLEKLNGMMTKPWKDGTQPNLKADNPFMESVSKQYKPATSQPAPAVATPAAVTPQPALAPMNPLAIVSAVKDAAKTLLQSATSFSNSPVVQGATLWVGALTARDASNKAAESLETAERDYKTAVRAQTNNVVTQDQRRRIPDRVEYLERVQQQLVEARDKSSRLLANQQHDAQLAQQQAAAAEKKLKEFLSPKEK